MLSPCLLHKRPHMRQRGAVQYVVAGADDVLEAGGLRLHRPHGGADFLDRAVVDELQVDVALGGEEVVITQNDQPVLKLIRVIAPKVRRKAGSAKGLITMASDFDAPLEDFRAYMQ